MLSMLSPSGGRRIPHCRTCGKPMKGHRGLECQLRSPSAELDETSAYDGSQSQSESEVGTPPPSRNVSGRAGPRAYPPNPISPEPSWTPPPEGVNFHRRNPYVEHPAIARGSPLKRHESWATTVPGDCADSDSSAFSTPTQSFAGISGSSTHATVDDSRSSSISEMVHELEATLGRESSDSPTPSAPGSFYQAGSSAPRAQRHRQHQQPVVIDTAGNNVSGVDITTLGDNIKGVLRQAEECGFMAAVVRPRLGYKRGAINIKTNEDADRLTTVFVATGPDAMSINMVYSDTLRHPKLMNVAVAGNLKDQGAGFWAVAFLVIVAATVVGGFVNRNLFW